MTSTIRGSTPFRRALANVGWLLTGKGVGAVLSVVYLALATRSLGVEKFGQFTLILSTGQAAAAFVGFQTWQIVVRYGMPHLATDQGALGRLVRFCLSLDIAAALVGCVIASGALLVMELHFGWSRTLTVEAIAFCLILLLSVRSTAVGILRLHDRFAIGAAADAVTPIVRCAGAILAVWNGASVFGFLAAWAAAEIATAIVYWVLALRYGPGMFREWRGTSTAVRENVGLWHFALVTNIGSTLTNAGRQLVVVLVGVFTGAAAAGNYRLASQLSQALVRLSDMFARGIFPEITRADAGRSRDALRVLLRQSGRLAIGAGAITCLLVPILGQPALHLVAGARYLGAYPLLVLLGIAAGLDIVSVGFEPILQGTGHAAQALRIRAWSMMLLFTGVFVLMPSFDAMGAGVATLSASALAAIMFVRSTISHVSQRHKK